MHARRALLYMPGCDWHKIQKALSLEVDCICMDMEDGVAFNRKVDARMTIAKALQELEFGQSEKLVRINPFGSGLENDDLEMVLPLHPDGVVVPKIDSLETIRLVSEKIESAEKQYNWLDNSIRLIVIVENAQAILNLKEIASHPRLDALIFGAEDFAADIGAIRTKQAWEVFSARSAVVTAAAAFSLQAIDMVSIDYTDLTSLREEAQFGAQLGYSGKQIIHPSQVAPVQEAFTPDETAIDHARKIISSFEEYQTEGKGAFALGGKMIDMPLVRIAQNVLERARVAGKVD